MSCWVRHCIPHWHNLCCHWPQPRTVSCSAMCYHVTQCHVGYRTASSMVEIPVLQSPSPQDSVPCDNMSHHVMSRTAVYKPWWHYLYSNCPHLQTLCQAVPCNIISCHILLTTAVFQPVTLPVLSTAVHHVLSCRTSCGPQLHISHYGATCLAQNSVMLCCATQYHVGYSNTLTIMTSSVLPRSVMLCRATQYHVGYSSTLTIMTAH